MTLPDFAGGALLAFALVAAQYLSIRRAYHRGWRDRGVEMTQRLVIDARRKTAQRL